MDTQRQLEIARATGEANAYTVAARQAEKAGAYYLAERLQDYARQAEAHTRPHITMDDQGYGPICSDHPEAPIAWRPQSEATESGSSWCECSHRGCTAGAWWGV